MVDVGKGERERIGQRGGFVILQYPVDDVFHVARLSKHAFELLPL